VIVSQGDEKEEAMPEEKPVPITLNDLTVMDAAIKGYLAFLRGAVKPSQERYIKVELLQNIRQRLKPVLSQQLEGTPIPLTFNEVQAIDAALVGFVWIVRRAVPPSKERDDALAGFDGLRHKLASLVTL
jgi:hypothetical protein